MFNLIKVFQLKKNISFNKNIGKVTWFGTGGSSRIFFRPYNENELALFLKLIPKNFPRFILGLGSNIIFRDGFYNGAVIKLDQGFNYFKINNNELKIGAGTRDIDIVKYTLAQNITGFEFLVGIPGTLGGSLTMNSSCFDYCISDNLISADIMDQNGNVKSVYKDELMFSYRNCKLPKNHIFINATFKFRRSAKTKIKNRIEKFKAKRKETQPIGARTGGSTFMNHGHLKAWKLIEKCGLRGEKFGNAKISDKHCNFLINLGSSSSTELEILGEDIIEKVFKKEKIRLEWEIKRVGNFKKI